MRGITPCKKDLQAIARPFCRVTRLLRRTERDATLRTQFVKEEACGQARGVNCSTGRCRQIICGDEQQVRIDGIHAQRVGTPDLKCRTVNIFECRGLLLVIFAEPVSVLHVRRQDGVVVAPAMERIHGLRRKQCCGLGHRGVKRPDLPGAIHSFQKGDATVIG